MDGGKEVTRERYMMRDEMKARVRREGTGRHISQAVKYYMCSEMLYTVHPPVFAASRTTKPSRDPSIKKVLLHKLQRLRLKFSSSS